MATPRRTLDGEPFIGRSRAIVRIVEQVQHLASGHAAVLIEGEAGTGKGGTARAIHALGSRPDEIGRAHV